MCGVTPFCTGERFVDRGTRRLGPRKSVPLNFLTFLCFHRVTGEIRRNGVPLNRGQENVASEEISRTGMDGHAFADVTRTLEPKKAQSSLRDLAGISFAYPALRSPRRPTCRATFNRPYVAEMISETIPVRVGCAGCVAPTALCRWGDWVPSPYGLG